MISHFPRRRNGTKRQFLPCAIVYFDNTAVKEALIPQPSCGFSEQGFPQPGTVPSPGFSQKARQKAARAYGPDGQRGEKASQSLPTEVGK